MLHHETGTTPTGEEGNWRRLKAFYHMTDPDMKQLEDLAAATIASFVMNEQVAYFLAKTRKDNSEIGEDEIVVLTITRKFLLPPVHPLPVMDAVKELVPA